MEFQKFGEYRGDVFIFTMNAIVLPWVLLNVWVTVAEAKGGEALDTSYLVQYYYVQIIVNVLVSSWHGRILADRIRTGELLMFLLKPYEYIRYMAANNVSEKVWKILFSLVALIPLYFIYQSYLTIPVWQTIPVAFVSVFLAGMIKFFISQVIGLAGFWTNSVNALRDYNEGLSLLFSGRLFPIQYATKVIPEAFFTFLPYYYFLGFPVNVILGHVTGTDLWFGIGVQCFWVGILYGLHILLWKKGLRRYGGFGQ